MGSPVTVGSVETAYLRQAGETALPTLLDPTTGPAGSLKWRHSLTQGRPPFACASPVGKGKM